MLCRALAKDVACAFDMSCLSFSRFVFLVRFRRILSKPSALFCATRLFVFVLGLAAGYACAAERLVAMLTDPAGDDLGDGTLVYPAESDLSRGNFDLRSLEVSRDDKGFWFVVTFGDFIRELWWTPGGSKGLPVRRRNHRLPFGFNLDLYIDIDRKPASGQMFTLPGRKARIDRRYAWERAIILSPQPMTARDQLLAKLKANFPGRPQGEAEAAIDKTMYFPVKKAIHDKSIRFFVPQGFFGDTDGEDWAITAFVTMATPVENDDNLGVRQPEREPPPDGLGYSDPDHVPSPVIDVLLPGVELQYKLLSAGRPLVGSSWGPGAVDEIELDDSVETFAFRLKEVKDLFDHHLIDEADYKAQRDRILREL